MDWLAINWQDVDWGNAPAWIGSLLTGGSLLWGVMVFSSDRRRNRRSQIVNILTWSTDEPIHNTTGPVKYVITIFVANESERPVFDYEVRRTRRTRLRFLEQKPSNHPTIRPSSMRDVSDLRSAIKAGERVTFRAEYAALPTDHEEQLFVYVRDSAGVAWRKNPAQRTKGWKKVHLPAGRNLLVRL